MVFLHLGSQLQALRNMDLVLAGLGVDPAFFHPLPPIQPPAQFYAFGVDSMEVQAQKADSDHSDSDWLTIIVSIGNPITKNIQTLPA
jgi:hypothetical protein